MDVKLGFRAIILSALIFGSFILTGCFPKAVTKSDARETDEYGCRVPPATTFTAAGLNLEFAQSTFGKIVTGELNIETKPEVLSLASKAAINAQISDYIRCLAKNRDGYTNEQAAYLSSMDRFMETKPSPDEFRKWQSENPFPKNDQLNYNSLKELKYKQNSLAYRPHLEFVGKPAITGVGFVSDSIQVVDDTLNFVAEVRFNATMKLVNKEKHLAKIVAEATTDTLYGEDYLRQLILSQDERIKLFPVQDMFPFKEIGYLDTLLLTINHQVRQVSENQEGILHFFVMYQNEAGNLYDIYYWTEFSFQPVPIVPGRIKAEELTGLPIQEGKVANMDMMKAIEFKEKHVSQYIYSKQQRDRIIEFFKVSSIDPSKITFPVKISTRGSVIKPASDQEVWKFRTEFSYSGYPRIRNVKAFVWLDSLASFTEIPKDVDSKILNFVLVETHESVFNVPKIYINRLLERGKQVYKHSVVIFENLKEQKYRSILTEKLEIEKKKVRLISVKREIGNPI
ncbi:MAG: hypothetical protein GWN62_23360 [Aliifodinibius sp.]|nr:hypothetical protein [Fodinibius sp.]